VSEGLRAWGTLLVALAAVLWPLAHGRDGYPLSTYPMFARPRPVRERVDRAIGRRGGVPVQLPLSAVGGEEPMQVVMTLGREIRAGRSATLCADVARRVAADRDLAGVDEVEIATEVHDALAYFGDRRPPPVSRTVRARCPVPR
jgi:hypothetical protein